MMEYRKLGATGLDVSRLCLGCMTFGEPDRGTHGWTLPEEESRDILRHAIDSGINFFDTANVYSLGSSEEILGRAIRDYGLRDEVVIATKVSGRMHDGPNGGGLSRKAIFAAIDASLARLQTDYVDLYQVHRPDPVTPIEETLEALNDIVKAGKVRYIGASSMPAWQFCDMLNLSERQGWATFVTMQNHLNLLYREEEREMMPLCKAKCIGIMPWSPLARGKLTRAWDQHSERAASDERLGPLYGENSAIDRHIVGEVVRIAEMRRVSPARIALRWILQKHELATPIVGSRTIAQLDESIAALNFELSAEEMSSLEAHYKPREVAN